MAIHFFKRSSLNQSPSQEEPFSKILFYSVMAHYIVFYFLFGNPLLLLTPRGGGPPHEAGLDIQLFSPGQIEPGSGEEQRLGKKDFRAFLPEEGLDGPDEPESAEKVDPLPSSDDAIKAVETVEPSPPPVAKKVARKLPRNMTGPEDCMMKVVAMVCPEGDAQCITEYREFCSNLPD